MWSLPYFVIRFYANKSSAAILLTIGAYFLNKEHEVLFIKGLRRKKLRFDVLPDSSLCQNGKQVEIITKMIFELCYIEAII